MIQRVRRAEIISRKVDSSQSDPELRVESLTPSRLCRINASKFLMFILTSLERRKYVQLIHSCHCGGAYGSECIPVQPIFVSAEARCKGRPSNSAPKHASPFIAIAVSLIAFGIGRTRVTNTGKPCLVERAGQFEEECINRSYSARSYPATGASIHVASASKYRTIIPLIKLTEYSIQPNRNSKPQIVQKKQRNRTTTSN